jgi:hypothetical protein
MSIYFGLNLEYRDNWMEIINTLSTRGPQEVTLGQLKPYLSTKKIYKANTSLLFVFSIKDLLTPDNLLTVWQKTRNKTANYFDHYIKEEFLAPIKTPECRNYVGLWFNDIQQGKFWAIRSHFKF